MSRASTLLAELQRQDVAVRVVDGRLQVKASKWPLPPALAAAVRAHKADLVRLLSVSPAEGDDADTEEVSLLVAAFEGVPKPADLLGFLRSNGIELRPKPDGSIRYRFECDSIREDVLRALIQRHRAVFLRLLGRSTPARRTVR